MSKTIVQTSSTALGAALMNSKKKMSRLNSPKSELVNHLFTKG